MQVQRLNVRPGERLVLDNVASQQALLITAIHRGGAVKMNNSAATLVVCLRGNAIVNTSHGLFEISARRWLLVERESMPLIDISNLGSAWVIGVSGPLGRIIVPGSGKIPSFFFRRLRSLNAILKNSASLDDLPIDAEIDGILDTLNLTQDTVTRVNRCPGRSQQRRLQVYARLERARMLIEGNTDRIVGVTELADATHFSRWYLSRLFTQVFGVSPQEYAIESRLRRARVLLERRAFSIGEIASRCGFENQSAFARAFRRRFGCNASATRAS